MSELSLEPVTDSSCLANASLIRTHTKISPSQGPIFAQLFEQRAENPRVGNTAITRGTWILVPGSPCREDVR